MKKSFQSMLSLLLGAVLLFSFCPAMAADGPMPRSSLYMYVSTGNSGGLNLRSYPSQYAQSLGVYANGTQVLVDAVANGWANVVVGGRRGYMLFSSLAYENPVPSYPLPPVNPPKPTENTRMYVQTGNSGKLHLREYPSKTASSLGLYPNGTPVTVTARTGAWAYVAVNGRTGYMMLQFLTLIPPAVLPTMAPAPTPIPSPADTLYIFTGNSGKLHLRQYPSKNAASLGLYPNGTPVLLLARTGDWAYVQVNGNLGYMMMRFLATQPIITPTQPPLPTGHPGSFTTMYIQTGNAGRLHLRQLPTKDSPSLGLFPNGTKVQARNLGSGWAAINVSGLSGYMMLKFLSPNPPAFPPVEPEVGNTLYVQTGNSGKLHLREQPSTGAPSLGLFPNGTPVTVLAKAGSWLFVEVYGQKGYMMRQMLSGNQPLLPTTPVPPPATEKTTMYVWTGNSGKLHLRQLPGQDAPSLGLYPNGTSVTVLARLGGWAYVDVNGQKGYMMLSCLTPTVPSIPKPTTAPVPGVPPTPTENTLLYVKTGNWGRLHLRELPDANSKSLGLFDNGTEVRVLTRMGGWAFVQIGLQNGYMMLQFLSPEAPEIPVEAMGQPGRAQVKGKLLNLRSSKDSEIHNVLMQIPGGTEIKVLEWGDPWTQVEYNQQMGFVVTKHLQYLEPIQE